jgi:hypothetical protein
MVRWTAKALPGVSTARVLWTPNGAKRKGRESTAPLVVIGEDGYRGCGTMRM